MLKKPPAFSTPAPEATDPAPPRIAEAERGGFFVEYRGIPLYSRVDPRATPERSAAGLPLQEDTLYLVPSPLLGYGLGTLLDRLPASSAVLALEADSRLAELASARISQAVLVHPRFRFLSDPSRAEYTVHALGRFRRCVEVPLSFGRKLHPEAYDRALESVNAELTRYWRNRMTMVHMGRLWARNLVRNLGRLPEADIREPRNWGGPIVVCGAGPSLEAACPWIASERNRLHVLSCDTAVGSLLDGGILPDAVVCLEGQIQNLQDFLPAGGREIPLFLDLTSHPSAYHSVRGPKFLTLTRYEPLSFLDRLESLPLPALRVPPLGSVGVLAVLLARTLTEGPVFLAGLDFSFPAGTTHARGSPALKAETLRQSRLYRARGQWKNSFSAEPVPGSRAERTGKVLASYAGLLAGEIQGDSRIHDIRVSGLPLGRPRIPFRDASGVLDTAVPPSPGLGLTGNAADSSTLRELAASFLTGELEKLENLLEGLRSDSPDLALRASECDWIYSWFPDEHRVSALPGDVRNRLLAEALDWRRRLAESIRSLEGT